MSTKLLLLLVLSGGVLAFVVLTRPASPTAIDPGSTSSPPGTPPSCPPPGTRLLFVGDSYAVGLEPYLKALAAPCVPWAYSAQVGSNISKWKGWIGPLLDSFRPTHVLFSQGGNDFGRSGEAVKVAADIDSFLQQIKSAGAIAMWVAPPETPFPDVIGVREMWWDRIAKYWRSIDSRELQIPRAGDSLGHPSQAGYKLWSEWIWPWFATVTWT